MILKPLFVVSFITLSAVSLSFAQEADIENTQEGVESVTETSKEQSDAAKEGVKEEVKEEPAANDEVSDQQAEPENDNSKSKKEDSVDRINENLRFGVNFSVLDMPFPASAGLSLIYQNHPKWMLEFNYLRNLFALNVLDVDTKEIGQQHFSIKAHYFIRENYYATVGIGKRFTTARMSDDYFNYNNYSIDSTLSKFSTDYITIGGGSVFKLNDNLQLNVDWAAFNFAFSNNVTASAANFAIDEQSVEIVSDYEDRLQNYMSNSFIRLTLLGQY